MAAISTIRDLVLGGAGLIGSELVKELRQAGNEVRSLDLVEGVDLRTTDLSCFREYDRIWFLAWDSGGAPYLEAADRQHGIYRDNCELALRVFDALASTGKPFLFTTSQLAGLPNGYGTTKLLGENWALQIGGRVARLWNVYGWETPRGRSHVISDFVLEGVRTGTITCRTDGRERRRFLYKTDAAAALRLHFDGASQIADIAGPEWLSIRQVADEVARQLRARIRLGLGRGAEVMIEPRQLLPIWAPQVTVQDGIARVITEARIHLAASIQVLT